MKVVIRKNIIQCMSAGNSSKIAVYFF